jgi:threonine/homoserine/homoserine lactone efflux protein
MRFIIAPPRRPKHPLLARAAFTVVAALSLVALFAFSVVALAIVIVGGVVGLIWLRWRLYRLRKQVQSGDARASRQRDDNIIEGDYVVVDEHHDSAR